MVTEQISPRIDWLEFADGGRRWGFIGRALLCESQGRQKEHGIVLWF